MKPPALLSADYVVSSETELRVGHHGEARLGTRTTRRVGATVTGNREPTILPQPLHLRNRRRRVEMFQSRRRLLLTGNVTTAIPFRTRSFFGISSRHRGPQKVGGLAWTLRTFL